MKSLKELENEVVGIVENVSNNPKGRYDLRYDFYERYGNPIEKDHEGLGNSELSFIEWEIKRGVLNPLNADQPGSRWWRSVNSHFLYLATLADLIYQSGKVFDDLPQPAQFWIEYIQKPNEVSWYKAHNSTIIAGYITANKLAFSETIYEQYFMNIVLYRLLYAQSMVEGVSFGILGKIFGNPRGGAVSIITDIESFYPSHYPLSKEDIKYVTHHAHNLEGLLEGFFDEVLILPHLEKLYIEAFKWNLSPELLKFININKPIYPFNIVTETNTVHFSKELKEKIILLT